MLTANPLSEGLDAAIAAAGSQTALAVIIGRSQQTISDWRRHGKPLPAEDALIVEEQLGVARHVTRPDLWTREHLVDARAGARFTGIDRRVAQRAALAAGG